MAFQCCSILGKVLLTLGLVLIYYCFSIGITFYNKWLLKSFHFPLFMTLVHLIMIFLLSGFSRLLMACYTSHPRVILPWKDYLKKVVPTALATALDIGLSNWSFLYITVSLYTMTKSSAVLFILFFSLVFKLEEMRPALILVVLLISGGLFMFTFKSTQFDTGGFVLVLAASGLGGVRWTLTQLLMQKAELGLQNPIDTMYHLQPVMFLSLFPLFIGIEGFHVATSEQLFCSQDTHQLLTLIATLALGGFLAFGLGFSEFLLVSKTSSLTLSIAGIFKELCVLLLATHLLGDELNILNWLGFAVCIAGIALHVALKATHSRGGEAHKQGRELPTADMELLLRGHEDEEEEET
ncbi:solute carrier family 35 (GDP-fucose transporter), member C2 S homeolog [Xenopus laevis]|uniref:MGC81943 protein n=1 Tax=Xenopus laevis TaxID=8355 RepID=Q6DJN6_XENLA|nr:solute carrier family 35 (GDP-fucose transporter), member C2 S homeolog [Xenopus laevis]AAH75139.1 MGC81943 protein [Xenopus laevis]